MPDFETNTVSEFIMKVFRAIEVLPNDYVKEDNKWKLGAVMGYDFVVKNIKKHGGDFNSNSIESLFKEYDQQEAKFRFFINEDLSLLCLGNPPDYIDQEFQEVASLNILKKYGIDCLEETVENYICNLNDFISS